VMETVSVAYYWIRIGALVVLTLFAVVTAIVQLRRRRYSLVRRVILAVVSVAAVFALQAASGVKPSLLWMVGLLVVGLGLGWMAGRMSRVYEQDGAVLVARSAYAPVLAALAYVWAALTLLFGTSYLFAIALLILAFSAGLSAGSALAELIAARGVSLPPVATDRSAEAPGEA
jgi:hypothetical protein